MRTVMQEAFERAGGPTKAIAAFDVAVALFMNNGGTYEEAEERLRVAYGLSGEAILKMPSGHSLFASARQPEFLGGGHSSRADGHLDDAFPEEPNGDEAGQQSHAEEAIAGVPASSPQNRGGSGLTARAGKGHGNPAAPVREPSELQRRVMGHVAKVAAGFSLDTYKVRDGRLLMKVKRGELRSIAATNRNEAMLLEMLRLHLDREYPGGDMLAEVGDLVDRGDAKRLFDRSKEIGDAA